MPSETQEEQAMDAVIDAARAGDTDTHTAAGRGLPAVSPDIVEQTLGGEMDDTVPTRGYGLTTTVCLGGSAGGIQALREFFDAMPADSGLVFVVVLHLSPEHASTLPELLGRHTAMPVVQAEDAMVVAADHVYVIPPGKHLVSVDGHLKLTPLEPERGKRVAVDVFFRTLADTHGPHAVAVVLSGADGDGAVGLKRIKERGGLTIAQDLDEAEHDSMPRTAIATGMVDWVLKVGEMPARLIEYTRREARLQLPPEDGAPPAHAAPPGADEAESALREVLTHLRTRTGRDFAYYKRATILRRVSRRMQVNGLETIPDYFAFLRTHPGESGALLQDLLISVTNFFRDREVFMTLEAHIPALFEGKGPTDTVRAWVTACATGEEAYSVAMLLFEHARTLSAPPRIQVFATDLAEDAIQRARDGVYTGTITTDVSEERLGRFFVKEQRGYRVRRELREIVLFAQHDLLRDSPFSKLDLVTCRNLLIYLNRDAQRRAMDLFHFALVPGGHLFLGTSETVDDASDFFAPADKKNRIYVARPTQRLGLPVPAGPNTLALAAKLRERTAERPAIPPAAPVPPSGAGGSAWPPGVPPAGNVPSSEMQLRLLAQLGPPVLIVNAQEEIIHLSGAAARYLQFDSGVLTRNLLQAIHPMLRIELRAALYRAGQTRQPTDAPGVPVELDGQRQTVDIRVAPARDLAPGHLVIFLVPGSTPSLAAAGTSTPGETDPAAEQLEHELDGLKSHVRDLTEQHEVSMEEQKAGSEELQAMNEELRSASEELETSREELQSLNEELMTVNQELKNRVEQLGHTNSDLHNLMNATAIASVFLDREMRITRYTPSATALFNLIPGDHGRKLSDLRGQLDYPELEADAARVLARLIPVEREVGRIGDGCFLVRLLPYRTLDDRIAGLVLTFVDITERKNAENERRRAEERLRFIVNSARDYAIFTTDLERRLTSWSPGAENILGYTEAEILGQSADILWVPEDRAANAPALETATATREGRAQNERFHLRKDGERFYGSGLAMPLREDDGRLVGFVKIMRDLTEAKRTEDALRDSEARFRTLFDSMAEAFAVGIAIRDAEGHVVDFRYVEANPAFERQTGLINPIGHTMLELIPGLEPAWMGKYADVLRTGAPAHFDMFAGPLGRWLEVSSSCLDGPGGERLAIFFTDVTERRGAAEALRASEERLQLVLESARDFAIFTTDAYGIITSWNSGAEVLFGYPAKEIVGRNTTELCTPEDRAARMLERETETARNEGRASSERWHCREDGTHFFGSGSVVPLTVGVAGQDGFLIILSDRTQARAAEDALEGHRQQLLEALQENERARLEVEAAGRAKDHFLAVLSHELRTPLTPIVMTLAILAQRTDLPESVRNALAMIERNVRLEAHFIDDLMDMARISRGKMEIVLADMDLHQAIERAVEICAPDLTAKEQPLTVELDATETRLSGDFARLEQVLWNLLKNASKFTPEGGAIRLRSRNEPGWIVVEVTDTGIGMDADVLERIFHAFEQADAAITREFGGLGLGLAIAQATVEAHGGELRASSPGRGQGATFTVCLPLVPAPANF